MHSADEPGRRGFVKTIATDSKMNPIKPEVLEYELKRWMRPNAHLFIRPDWRRHVAGGSEAAALYALYERKYRPDQARIPAGSREGGRWTDEEEQTYDADPASVRSEADEGYRDRLVRVAQANSGTITDAFGEPYYRPGGHHEAAQGVYKKWNLAPETRKIFEESTTGKVPAVVRLTPDGTPIGNIWSKIHKEYNQAFNELVERYVEKNRITIEQMTPDHAREVLKEIRESTDPRIRTLNDSIRLIRRAYRFRTGRE